MRCGFRCHCQKYPNAVRLSKAKRKEVNAVNADRIAKRLAKKKARNVLMGLKALTRIEKESESLRVLVRDQPQGKESVKCG